MIARFSFSYFSLAYFYLFVLGELFHLCLSNLKLDNVLCLEEERQALFQFKNGLIDEEGRLGSWVGEESDCCKWAGIVCDNSTGHVHVIHLPGLDGHCRISDYTSYKNLMEASKQRFRGNLSSSLLHLKQLRHLDISCNDFQGIRVPSFLGSLRNLRYLNLSNSEFAGNIPPQLGNLSELHVLCLGSFGNYKFESTRMLNMQWLSSLRMLHHLDLSGVNLSKANDWLQVINVIPSLVELHLSSCLLGNINPQVNSLNITSLSLLDLSFNHFDFVDFLPPWILSITSLVSLDLSGCQFHGLIPSSIDSFRNLTSLEFLHVSRNNFMNSSIILKGLSSTVGGNLITLDISDCGISSPVLDSLHNLTSLVRLDLSRNQLTKTITKSLGNLCNLRDLDLSYIRSLNTSLTYVLESFLECKSPSLESLILRSLGLFGPLPDQLGQLTHMVHLELDNNHIDGSFPASIGRLSSLRTLKLFANLISGPIPFSIGQLSSMEVMDLSGNLLDGSLPDSIKRLSSLQVLDLSHNRLNGSVRVSLCPFSKLRDLDLSFNLLSGPMPNSIGCLSSLESLDVSNNQFSTSLPDSIGQLKSLKMLDLSDNQLDGSLPDSIGQLSLLETFYLSNNRVNGSIPDSLGQLTKLKYLDFRFNLLNGPIPKSIGALSSLEDLDLSNNQFTGTLPNRLGNLQSLKRLLVYNNLLNGLITAKHFTNLTALKTLRAENIKLSLNSGVENWVPPFQLEVLRIGSWNLGPHFPLWLQSQRNLRELDIANTGISDIMPIWFSSSFSNIVFLNISHNNIQGEFIGDLSIFERLLVADLSNNHFTGPLHRKFNEFGFVLLDVSNNHLSGSLEEFLCPSFEISRPLQVLDLANNNLSGAIPDCWMNWQDLSVLNIENNGLTGEIPQSVGHLSYLLSLNFRNNKLSGNLPAVLFNLKLLQIIELAENEFTGSIPLSIGNEESKLKLISLRLNKLEGGIPEELCRFTSIQILDLAHNNLSGKIPSCFNNFSSMSQKQNFTTFVPVQESALSTTEGKVYDNWMVMYTLKVHVVLLVTKGREYEFSTTLFLVTTLDLSGNKFSGSIPKEIMGLVGLCFMNLSENHLTGRIPEEIGKMTSLESLDLSANQIDGTIPWIISSLTSLNSLNLSFNKLTGEIPKSTQLQSLSESSFMGNSLCGSPLAEQCNKKGISPDANTGDISSDRQDSDWGFIISIVLGFLFGFWIVVAPVIASNVWRSAFFYFLYKLWFKIRIVCTKYF